MITDEKMAPRSNGLMRSWLRKPMQSTDKEELQEHLKRIIQKHQILHQSK